IEAFHELLVERDLDREQEILSRIIEKYPKEKQAHILMAQSHYMKGQVDEEIAEYEKVLELDPREARAYNTLAYIFVVQRDDFDRAMRYLDVYDTLLPGLANPVDSRAELLIRAGRFEEAKALLEKVLEIKHDFPYVGVKLGYCYAMEEDYTEALKWIDYHITVSAPKAWKAGGYVMRSYVYQVTGREDLAREDLQTALDIYALVDNVLGRVGAQWLAGWSHLESGGFGEARRFFTATLDDPRERFLYSMPQRPPVIDYDFSLSFSLGMLAVREGDLPGARTLLSDIDSFMPRIHFQYVDLATIYRNMLEAEISISKGDHKRAIELLEVSPRWTIPRFHPSFFVPFIVPYQKDLLARAYIHVGEPEKAIAEYEWLISAGPERELCPLIHPLYHYRLALLYEEA
ncbi:MAG TPA: tetratricopeptide repeat protein, partial [Candidatus Krumholzibacterium sp.]|nr:tetratricopeptide repeat protein [Candidatus Krumholzibacterium sp.]